MPATRSSKVLLEETDKAIEDAKVLKPDAGELEAIKHFCTAEIQRKKSQESIQATIKELRLKQKECKTKLEDQLNALQSKCAAVTKAQLKPGMQPFVRLVQANKDAGITPETIQEAIEAVLSDEETQTALSSSADAKAFLQEAILASIRRIIRSFTERLKLLPNLPKGQSVYDVTEATDEMATLMFDLWTTEKKLKEALAKKKETPEAKAKIKELKDQIETFFIRTGLTAQRIVVEGNPYRLVRRISVRNPKVGIGKFEKMLTDALAENTSISEDMAPALIKQLQILVTSIPPESKSFIAMHKVTS